MSNFKNGNALPQVHELYGGSTTFIDNSTVFVDMTRDELWKWFEEHGYLRENPLINIGGK